MKSLVILALCLLAFAFAEDTDEKKDPAKVPVVPYPGYYYPYTHYYSPSYYKPVSSFPYHYGGYYHPQTPYKYFVPSYLPLNYYPLNSN